MRYVAPQILAMLFQPGIQRRQIWKVRHLLPKSRSGILNILLDLTLLPTRGGIAKLRRKDVVVRHSKETDIDLPFFATTDTINRGLHVVVNAATRYAAKHAEPVPVGVEEHLVRLQQVGTPDCAIA